MGVLQLLEEQQQECHRMDAISVSPRNEWTEVDIEEVEEEGVSGDAQKRAKIWLLGDLPGRNHPMRTVHLYSKRNGCKKLWSNLRNRSELYYKQQPRPAKEHACC